MSREGYLLIGAINIIMPPPHSPERYADLFIRALKLGKTAKLIGDWVGLLGSCKMVADESGQNYLRGEFYKYIDLEVTRDWFNLSKGKKAEAEDLAEIRIPEHLKPHFQFLPFVVLLKGHRLFFISRDRDDHLTPAQAQKILAVALSHPKIISEFGQIETVIEQSSESLDLIFGMPHLRTLTIEIAPPNSLDDLERQLLDELHSQEANKKTIILTSDRPNGLKPSNETRRIAEVALSHGGVSGVGGPRGKTSHISTQAHPLLSRIPFMYDIEVRSDKLLASAKELLSKIRRSN